MNVESVQSWLYLFQASLITWIRVASPCILFGLYYGLLSTFPIGPSHILSIRYFLLKGNTSGIVSLSGLMISQLIIFLSIFCSPLYILLLKPHAMTLLIVPYLWFYWFRTKDLSDYQMFRPIRSLVDLQIYKIFIDSFILQILNPILLPSPVLARLIHLFLFRYSNNGIFLISTFLGWLLGHILFLNLCKLLLVRIESDSPILYILIKRIINKTFSIIIYISVLLYLGKAPVSLFTHKIEDTAVLLEENFRELPDWTLWMLKQWPTSFFDQYKSNRPVRYIRNSRLSNDGPVKRQVATHLFNKCLTDGKERMTFTSLPSLLVFDNQFQLLEYSKNIDFYGSLSNTYKWISDQSIRNESLINELKDRVQYLDTEFIFSNTVEKRTELVNENNERLSRLYNPFLSNSSRVKIPTSRSFWILYDLIKSEVENDKDYTEDLVTSESDNNKDYTEGLMKSESDNNKDYIEESDYYARIEDWISNKYQQLNSDKIPLPWETLSPRAQELFFLMFEDSNDIRINKIFTENDLLSVNSKVIWEHVFQLPPTERELFFIYLKEDCNGFDWINLLEIVSIGKKRSSYSEQRIRSSYKAEELVKELNHNTPLIFDTLFDIVGGVTDIRNRKLKNLGIGVGRTRTKTRRIMKRFSESSDFRRRLIKGSMRSRRRKMLVWKLFQEKTHSPFFLRLMEIPHHSVRNFVDSKVLTIDPEYDTKLEFEQQLSAFSSSKDVQALRSLLSARLDVNSIHTGRGLLLVLQSNLRKYIKLPILIALKNIVRVFLFQAPEWNQDWSEWHKESHINCTYDGEEFSDTDLPGRWLKEGLQVKIIHPFQLKPWHNHTKKQSILHKDEMKLKNVKDEKGRKNNSKVKQRRLKATYLTIWGFQTDRPFGTIHKEPSFWKLIRRELRKTWKKNLSLRTRQLDSFCSRLGMPRMVDSNVQKKDLNPFNRFRVTQDNSSQNAIRNNTLSDREIQYKEKEKSNSDKIHRKSIQIASDSQLINVLNNKKSIPDALGGSELKTGFPVHEPTNPRTKEINTNERNIKPLYLNKREIDRRLENKDLITSLRFKKKLVDIRRRNLRFRIRITEFIEKFLSPIMFLLQRIHRIIYHYSITLIRFQVQLLGVIKNTIEIDADMEESNLATRNTDKEILRVDDKTTRPLSQAYIYDNLWYTNGTDNVNLNKLMETLKDSATPTQPKDEKDLDKPYDWDDYEQEGYPSKYNDVLDNGDVLIKRRKSSIYPLHDANNNTKKHDLLECLNNIDDIPQQYIDKPVKDFVTIQGLFKRLSNLTADDWETWLGFFNRYNLPLEIWRKITPQEWRTNVENLNTFEEIERSSSKSQGKKYVSDQNWDDYCLYIENPSFKDRIKNMNKRHKYTHLLFNLISSLKRNGFEALKNEIRTKGSWKNHIKQPIANKKRKSLSHQPIFNLQRDLVPKTDLVLWIIPDLSETKDLSQTTNSRFVPNTCILDNPVIGYIPNEQDKYEDEFAVDQDEILLRDRLNHYYIFQWRWKSGAIYKRLQRFKDFLSIINALEGKQDLTKSYINMGIDLDLLDRILQDDRSNLLEDLFIVSAHRFSRLFDDQILMYKLVTILLKFRNRFRRRLDRDIFDECKLRLLLIDRRIDIPYLYNIDDVLLPRRCRELQFLGSIGIPKQVKPKEYLLGSTFQVQKTSKGEESKDSSKTQIIKRFLWPSHRLEELACINRFYLNTNNGSRFAIIKIRMYTVI